MKQSSSLLPGFKALAPCSRFWRRVVVYAPNLLGYTNNGSFRSTWSWGWFYVYFQHQSHLRCLAYPTGLQILRPLGLTTPHSHRLYAICSHFLPPTAQLSPFDCAVNSAYKQYIHWKRYELDVNSICRGLDWTTFTGSATTGTLRWMRNWT
jgi:hypothetical protein